MERFVSFSCASIVKTSSAHKVVLEVLFFFGEAKARSITSTNFNQRYSCYAKRCRRKVYFQTFSGWKIQRVVPQKNPDVGCAGPRARLQATKRSLRKMLTGSVQLILIEISYVPKNNRY